MTYRVLVTGSRFWADRDQLYAVLDGIRQVHGTDLVIVHGKTGGAPTGWRSTG